MAKYSRGAGKKVKRAMHEMKEGKLISGRSGQKVKSLKQAIAIGLSEARKEGAKVPQKKSSSKKNATKKRAITTKKKSPGKKKSTGRKSTTRKRKPAIKYKMPK